MQRLGASLERRRRQQQHQRDKGALRDDQFAAGSGCCCCCCCRSLGVVELLRRRRIVPYGVSSSFRAAEEVALGSIGRQPASGAGRAQLAASESFHKSIARSNELKNLGVLRFSRQESKQASERANAFCELSAFHSTRLAPMLVCCVPLALFASNSAALQPLDWSVWSELILTHSRSAHNRLLARQKSARSLLIFCGFGGGGSIGALAWSRAPFCSPIDFSKRAKAPPKWIRSLACTLTQLKMANLRRRFAVWPLPLMCLDSRVATWLTFHCFRNEIHLASAGPLRQVQRASEQRD